MCWKTAFMTALDAVAILVEKAAVFSDASQLASVAAAGGGDSLPMRNGCGPDGAPRSQVMTAPLHRNGLSPY